MRNILGPVHSVLLEIVGNIIYLLNIYAIIAEQLWQLETIQSALFTFPLPPQHQPGKALIYFHRKERKCVCVCVSVYLLSLHLFF